MRRVFTVAVPAALVVLAYVAWSAFGPAHYARYGQDIRHDDFVFSVLALEHRPGSTLWIPEVFVQNRARRVDYHWHSSIAYVVDAAGRRYGPVSDDTFTLAPGEWRIAHVRFDLPRDIQRPVLRFWDGVFMGDALNGDAYARTAVKLY